MDFDTIVVCVVAAFGAVMFYLRATAAKTKNKVDDRMLEVGEKVEPIVDFVKPKTK